MELTTIDTVEDNLVTETVLHWGIPPFKAKLLGSTSRADDSLWRVAAQGDEPFGLF